MMRVNVLVGGRRDAQPSHELRSQLKAADKRYQRTGEQLLEEIEHSCDQLKHHAEGWSEL